MNRVKVYINGSSLTDIDPRILLQDVKQDKPVMKTQGVSLLRKIGQLVTSKQRNSLSVTITFALACKRHEIEDRARILQMINAWAGDGGTLEISYRNGQMLRVRCDELPANGDMRKFDSTYSIKFTAYAVPYWEELRTVSTSGTGTVNLAVPGTAATPLDIDVTATGTISTMSVACDGQLLAFSFGNALTSGKRLEIRHDGSIMTGWIYDGDNAPVNALMYRTAASNDEIMLTPGRHELTVTGCTASLIVRGRWV